MGLRVRMRVDHDISWMAGQARVIAEVMWRYGMIAADTDPTGISQVRQVRTGTTKT